MKKVMGLVVIGAVVLSSATAFCQTMGPGVMVVRPGVYPTPKGEEPPRHKREGSEHKEEKKERRERPVPGADAGKIGSPFREYMQKHKIP